MEMEKKTKKKTEIFKILVFREFGIKIKEINNIGVFKFNKLVYLIKLDTSNVSKLYIDFSLRVEWQNIRVFLKFCDSQ